METAPLPKKNAVNEEYERLNIHYRIQHVLLFSSFLVLVFTGWPLRFYGVGFSRILMNMWGGLEMAAIVHRTAAVIMIITAAYHLGYLLFRFYRGKLVLAMIPTIKDVYDLRDMLRYYLGIQKEKPKFGKFTYWEKFDYWAVFWGMLIMVGSGLILWFPIKAVSVLPVWSLGLAKVAHSEEALLAASAIFLWHFYNVHLKPDVFPMSWIWITGRISGQEMMEQHQLEYEELMKTERERRAD
jgi:cytochrome b subunit of formate dehydrogenase